MIAVDIAIRRLAFAEARTSNAEAMMLIAAHAQEVERASVDGVSPEQEVERFAALAHEFDQSAGAAKPHFGDDQPASPAQLVDKRV